MSWYDDYEPQEPSEVDTIVEDALDKLEEYLIDHSKLRINKIIESAKSWEKKYHDCKTENRQFFSMITERDDKIKELTKELERKRTQLGILPFEPGEEVYFLMQNYSDVQKVTCPCCEGKGRIYINHDGVDYNALCPKCKDSTYSGINAREASYTPWKVACRKIERVTQVVTFNEKTREPETSTCYCIDRIEGVPLKHIRKKVEGGPLANEPYINELKAIADDLNKVQRDGCLVKVGRELEINESES